MASIRDIITKAGSGLRLPGLPSGTSTRLISSHEQRNAVSDQVRSMSDALGPGNPPDAQPIDSSGRARQFQYRPGWNLPTVPGESRIDFEVLRQLADLYNIMRKALEIRKDEVARLSWDIAPAASSVYEKRKAVEQNRDKLERARAFFMHPDKVLVWNEWIRAALEDHFVLDAISIHKRRTYSGELYALELIDGATIKPLLTLQGRTPLPPDTAYQQYLYGLPRVNFTTEELLYKPKNRRNQTAYGFSIIEQFAQHINLALRWGIWNTKLFTDGNIPQSMLTAPEGWQPDQIDEYMQLWDAMMSGDPAEQRKLKMVPFGVQQVGDAGDVIGYSGDFSDYLINITCVAADITRQELGLEPGNSDGLGGAGYAEGMRGVQYRRSMTPLCAWLSDVIFTPILHKDFDLPGFRWVWPDLDAEDPGQMAQTNQTLLLSGQKSLDELLMEQGEDPIGAGRMIQVGGTVYFEPDIVKLSRIGTLAQQEQQAQGEQQVKEQGDRRIAEHQAWIEQHAQARDKANQQELAIRQAQLEKQKMDQMADMERMKLETSSGLGQQSEAQKAALQQQLAEHGLSLEQQKAVQAAALQQQLLQQQSQVDDSKAMRDHKLSRQAAEHDAMLQQQQAQIAAQGTGGPYMPAQAVSKSVTPDVTPEPEPELPSIERQHDLSLWQRKAIKAVKAGRSGAVRFNSDAIEPSAKSYVTAKLANAATVDEVKAAFKDVPFSATQAQDYAVERLIEQFAALKA